MATKTKKDEVEKKVKALAEKIVSGMGFKASVGVNEGEALDVIIKGEDLGLLIGQYGSNLESLQTVLSVAVNKKFTPDWKPVSVDINDWRREKEENLRNLVTREIERLESVDEIKLPPMPPSQRRLVHLVVGEHGGIESESAGDEPYRFVVIKRQKSDD